MTMKSANWLWSLILFYAEIDARSKRNPINGNKYCADRRSTLFCATNGIESIVFPNKCLLKEALKTRKDLKRTSLRNCLHDYNKTTSYKRSNRTFNNIYWNIYKNGPRSETIFEKNSQRKRKRNAHEYRRKPIPCPRVFNPVCAYMAGVKSTFINECLVNTENVKYNKDWIVFSKGVCAEDYSYYSPRSHKSKRSLPKNQFHDFYENLYLGDDVIQIRPPSIFQTQFLKQDTPKTFVNTNADPFKYEQIYREKEIFYAQPTLNYKNYFTNLYREEIFPRNIPSNHKPFLSIGIQHNPYNFIDSTMTNIMENFKTNTQIHKKINTIKIFDCKLGKTPLCCSFQGNSKTFKNICELNLHNENNGEDWQISYEGSCNRCENNCPKTFDPVCASRNGLNYTIRNECLLKFEMCRDKIGGWKILKKGICENNELKIIRDKYESKKPGFKYISKFNKIQGHEKVQTETSKAVLESLHSEKPTKPAYILSNMKSFSEPKAHVSTLSNLVTVLPTHSKSMLKKEDTDTMQRNISKNHFEMKTLENSGAKMKPLFDKYPFVLPSHENNITLNSENNNTKTAKSLKTSSDLKSTIGKVKNLSSETIFVIKTINTTSHSNKNNNRKQSTSPKETVPNNVGSTNR